jgi:hypothetical protein
VTGRIRKPPVTVRNLLSQEELPVTKKYLKIDIQMDEHNAEEEMESAENVPLLQNAYKIFENVMNNLQRRRKTVRMETGDWHFVRKKGGLLINKSSRVIDILLKEKSKFGFME